MEICIDATFFLGLNSTNEIVRVATKNFVVNNLGSRMLMSYEQVAVCDNYVWGNEYSVQSMYFPFMDYLITTMRLDRKPYSEKTLQLAGGYSCRNVTQKLTSAFVAEHGGMLHTWDRELLELKEIPLVDMKIYQGKEELVFPSGIEELYRASLCLRIDVQSLITT